MPRFEVRGDNASGDPLFVTTCQSETHRDIEIGAARGNPLVKAVHWRELDGAGTDWRPA